METHRSRTVMKRIWAAIVDRIVFMPLLIITQQLICPTKNNHLITTWLIICAILPFVYSTVAHWKYGQTVGKWVSGVKVLDVREGNLISFKQAIIRDSVFLLIVLAGIVDSIILNFKTGYDNFLHGGLSDFVDTPFYIWTVAEFVTILANNKRRAIHDFLANSIVVISD